MPSDDYTSMSDTNTEPDTTPTAADTLNRRRRPSLVSLAVSLAALLTSIVTLIISVIAFSLHFWAHDAVSYVISGVSNAAWQQNNYVTVSLSVFNRGNRPAALISAAADLIKTKIVGVKEKITDDDCMRPDGDNTPAIALLPFSEITKDNPRFASTYIYSASIEADKLFTGHFSFSFFNNDKPEDGIEGIVCLEMRFADSRGFIYPPIIKGIEGVKVHGAANFVRIIPSDILSSDRAKPILVPVFDHSHFF